MHIVLSLLLLFPGALLAAESNDYPTLERVDYVLICMKRHGGQNLDNLYSCSCEIDLIASLLAFADYEEAATFERYQRMPGERGGMLRESPRGQELISKLRAARTGAEEKCFLKPKAVQPLKKD